MVAMGPVFCRGGVPRGGSRRKVGYVPWCYAMVRAGLAVFNLGGLRGEGKRPRGETMQVAGGNKREEEWSAFSRKRPGPFPPTLPPPPSRPNWARTHWGGQIDKENMFSRRNICRFRGQDSPRGACAMF